MKFRTDFVTNSSSSSFICEVCGHVESGFDMGIDDAGMYQCVKNHSFCIDHIRIPKIEEVYDYVKNCFTEDQMEELSKSTIFDKDMKPYELDEDSFREAVFDIVNNDYGYEIPEMYCPICNLDHIHEEHLLSYLCKKTSIKKEDLEEEIRKNYSSLEDFVKDLSE